MPEPNEVLQAPAKIEPNPPKKEESKSALVAAVTSPLNFFALVVMICEGIIGGTALLGRLSEQHIFDVVLLMMGLLALLVIVVGLITFLRPRHLSSEMAEALKDVEEIKQMLSSEGFSEGVQQIVESHFEITRKTK